MTDGNVVMLDLTSSAMKSDELNVQVDHVVGHTPLKVRDVNVHLVCSVCRGYLIDATTVTECLHSFCRSCVVKHVKKHHTCPACQVALSSTKPFSQLRRDHTLQSIVYKMAPNVARNELKRRHDFRRRTGLQGADAMHSTDDRFLQSFFAASDHISLSLQYARPNCGFGSNWLVHNRLKKTPTSSDESAGRRFYRCPSALPVGHLIKFLRCKYDVKDPAYKVEILYNGHPLCAELKLSDVAYIFSWTEKEPLKLWFRFTRTDEPESIAVGDARTVPRGVDAVLLDQKPCDLKKWRRVLKKCAVKKRTAKEPIVSSARPKTPDPPYPPAESPAADESKRKSPTPQPDGPSPEVEAPKASPEENGDAPEETIPPEQVAADSPKGESGDAPALPCVAAEENGLSDCDSNSASELVIDIAAPAGLTDEDEASDGKGDATLPTANQSEAADGSAADKSNLPPEEDSKSVKKWLPKAVFDLDDRDLLAKRLRRETAGIGEADDVKEKETSEPAAGRPEGATEAQEPLAVSSPLTVKVCADESARSGLDSPDVHDSIGALDLSGRSSDCSTDSPVPEACSPVKVGSPTTKASTSPSGRNYGPHPYFLTPSAIYSSLGLLQPCLIPAATVSSASVVEAVKTAAPIRTEANGSDVKRKALVESQRPLKKPKRGLWDLFGIPTSTSSAGIASTLTELNSLRRLMLPPSTHPT